MPSLFDRDRPEPQKPPTQDSGPDYIRVTDSELWCEFCMDVSTAGRYYVNEQVLVFVCLNGHENIVKDITLE